MTLQEQQAREILIKDVLAKLNGLEETFRGSPIKGKQVARSIQCYLVGWIDGKGGTPDPILYIAVIRGGDPRPEIESGLDIIAKSIKELSQ